MSVHIDSLDIQINSSAGSAAANIDALAQSLERLKSASGLTKVVNNLNKLKDSLNSLAGANLEPVKKVTQALSALQNIPKSEGLVSTANALKKLTKVASELDDATITQFTQKMRQLAEALAPLATSIDRIGAGFARLPKNVKAAAKAVGTYENAVESADSANGDFRGSLTDIMSHFELFADAVRMLSDWIAITVSEAKELDGITSRFVRVFGEGSQAMYDRVTEFNEVLGINKQEFMQYSGIFGSFAMGFGIPEKKISAFSTALTQLSYDIYSAYNDIYPNFEDAATAVKSAITGELEPIRNAGISISEASLKIVAANHGITESVETMTQSQKTLLYYQALVDAANSQGIVGNYARELNTAEGAIRSFKEAIKTLVQAIGTMFLPIIQTVLPWVTAFVNIMSDAASSIATFFGYKAPTLTPMADSAIAAGEGMENAAAAAKKLKSATMGFDELNVLSPNTGAAAGAGGANTGGDLAQIVPEDLWNTAMLENANNKVKEAEERIRALIEKIKPAIPLVGAFLAAWALYGPVKKAVDALFLAKDAVLAIKGALAGSQAAMSALSFINGGLANVVATFKAGGISGLLSSFGSAIGGFAATLGVVLGVIALVAAAIYFLYENWDKVVLAFQSFADYIGLEEKFQAIKDAVAPLGEKLAGLKDLFLIIGGIVVAAVLPVIGFLAGAFSGVVAALPGLIKALGGVIDILAGIGSFIKSVFIGDWEGAWEAIKKIGQGIVDIFAGLWDSVVGFLNGFVDGVVGFFVGLIDAVVGEKGATARFVNGVVDWFKALPGRVVAALKSFGSRVENAFVKAWAMVEQWYAKNVAPKFTLAYWANVFTVVKDGFVNAIKNAINGAITLMNRFIGWLNEKLNFSWDGLKIAGKTVFEGGSIQLFTIPSIPKLEKGGVLEDGLFTMNRGEIAGKFTNGKSVVANNEMIVEGISTGVYQAVVAAMNATKGSGEQAVNVYLDGKQIYASIKKTESERGRSIMGTQLGYSY
jgi:phage-related protein